MPAGMHSGPVSIPVTVLLVLVGAFYLRGWFRLKTNIPGWRAMSFLAGLLSVWLAVGSPLAMLDQDLLTAHMVQHILLMTIAAPLILLGSAKVFARGVFGPF